MAVEALSPELRAAYGYVTGRPCEWLSAREVADALKISYSASYGRLRRLGRLDLIREHVTWMRTYDRRRRRWIRYRRRFFHYVPPDVLSYLKWRECEWVSTREVARALGITYATAYGRLRRLAREGVIREYVTWIRVPYIRRRWFHYYVPPKYWKSHIIISMDYAEEHLFELHLIAPHLEEKLTDEETRTIMTLAFELMLDYGLPEHLITHRETTFNWGEVQTKGVKEFNRETEAIIFDVKTSGRPTRADYLIRWFIETTLTGERYLRYGGFEAIPLSKEELKERTMEKLKEEFKELVKEET